MSFGASAHFTSLQVEHVTEAMVSPASPNATPGAIPTAKPGTPQISYSSTPLNQYSLSGIVDVRVWVTPWPAPITFSCELVLDGVSQGVKTTTNPGAADFHYVFGDFDPLLNHDIEVYIWASADGYSLDVYPKTTKAMFETGTVSLTEKTVWLQPLVKSLAMLFSSSGIIDTTHLFTDNTQVTDYDLWWSGDSVVLKGTNFHLTGDLIYQRMSVE